MVVKSQELQTKKQEVVATEVEKEDIKSENTEKPPDPTHEEIKDTFGFTNISMHHSDGDDVTDFGFFQVGTNTEAVPVPNSTTLGVDETDDTITSMVDDTKMKTGMNFADIVRGNQSPKSVARVNPFIPDQKMHVPQNKQVARFTLAWWKPYLDSCATYHTAFIT